MPQFLQSYEKLYTVTPVVCHSPLGSGGVSLAPRQGLDVLCSHSTTAWVGGTLVRDATSGWRGDVGEFTVVWG